MTIRLRALWTRLLESLWFVPSAIGVASILLAVAMVELSAAVDPHALARFPRLFGASADSSRSLLASIGASIITVVGVTFSLTMVAVTQASAQYTSRILRTFMRDRPTQVVLGVFVGIFAYCLVVLRTIRSADESRFVPSLAVVLGIALALAGMGALIFFVHHMATTLQVSSLLKRVGTETVAAVDRLFPDGVAEEASVSERDACLEHLRSARWQAVVARTTGYLQSVHSDRLVRTAEQNRTIVRLEVPIGGFVIEGMPIAWTAAEDTSTVTGERVELRAETQRVDETIARCFTLGSFRTIDQDAGFGIRQIVDIALRALSPGVNDTTTAVNCLDWLGAVLVRLANRRIERPFRATAGVIRLIAPGPTFDSLLGLAVDEIRQNAGGNVTILRGMLAVLATVESIVSEPLRKRCVQAHRRLVAEHVERHVSSAYDRAQLRAISDIASGILTFAK